VYVHLDFKALSFNGWDHFLPILKSIVRASGVKRTDKVEARFNDLDISSVLFSLFFDGLPSSSCFSFFASRRERLRYAEECRLWLLPALFHVLLRSIFEEQVGHGFSVILYIHRYSGRSLSPLSLSFCTIYTLTQNFQFDLLVAINYEYISLVIYYLIPD